MEKCFFHVDLDAFFASVEELDHPEYRSYPLVVGALPGERGVVSTCNYEARKFGIRSAMPISQAQRLCPRAHFVRPRLQRYREVSNQIMALLHDYSPQVEQISIDEARLDMTGTQGLFGPPQVAAMKIKSEIRQKIGVTASVGIGPLPYLAKMASEEKKPDGLFEITADAVVSWLAGMDPSRLPGVGKKTRDKLGEVGLDRVDKIQRIELEGLQRLLGKAMGQNLYYLVRGQDPPRSESVHERQSISSETTFQEDNRDSAALQQVLAQLAHEVFFRTLEEGLAARTVIIKIRHQDFSLTTHQKSLSRYFSSAADLTEAAWGLFKKFWNGQPVRLLGIGLSALHSVEEVQTDLFEDDQARRRRLDLAVLMIQTKYRTPMVKKARFLERPRAGQRKSAKKDGFIDNSGNSN